MEQYCVYILSSKHKTLYVGSTSYLQKRIWQHKNKEVPGFTAKYNVDQLVYYEIHLSMYEAAKRERRLKEWPRQWKVNLIESINPDWKDLYLGL